MSPHRDPETGQFVSGGMASFDDIEIASFGAQVGVQASNLSGGTGFQGGDVEEFEGIEVLDYDDIVDRNEELHLLAGYHAISVFANSTQTADGTVSAAVEVSAAPSRTDVSNRLGFPTTGSVAPSGANAVGGAQSDDTIDLVGRVLYAVGGAPFSDTATGVGGAGSAGEDSVALEDGLPSEAGRFHPRDELFVNGRITAWNIADSGVHVGITGQHVYGVREE